MNIPKEQYDYQTEYLKNKYKRLPVSYPNDFAEEVYKAAEQKGMKLAPYIRMCIERQMEEDGFDQKSSASKYTTDEDGNRILIETTSNGIKLVKVHGGWQNTKTGEIHRTLFDCRRSTEA